MSVSGDRGAMADRAASAPSDRAASAPSHRAASVFAHGATSSPGSARLRRLGAPRPAAVRTGPGGAPVALAGVAVEAVREEWVVEDRWWTERPLRRRYLELVLVDGRDMVVFRDLLEGRWYLQRA